MESSTYAIIQSGSKQYRVEVGQFVDIELVQQELGSAITFQPLFVSQQGKALIGQPYVENFAVKGEIAQEIKGPKITSMKYKPSHNIRRRFGHRQYYHRVKITAIEGV